MASQAPDINRLSNAFAIVTEESAKLANIPAFDHGAQIIQAIAQLNQRFEQLNQRFEQRFEQLHQSQIEMQQTQLQIVERLQQLELRVGQLEQTSNRLETRVGQLEQTSNRLEMRVIYSNRNAVSRAQNSAMLFDDRKLAPLVSPVTGEYIQGFPSTLVSFNRMQDAAIDGVLLALEHDTVDGDTNEKRNKLREAIGLKVRES